MDLASADTITALARWAQPWHHEFTRSAIVSTAVLFAHIASLVAAGGLSFAADRSSYFPVGQGDGAARHALSARVTNRRLAIGALSVTIVSGLLLFLSDVDAFLQMPTFWVKLGLVGLLICNAILAHRHDSRLRFAGGAATSGTGGPKSRCRTYAFVSLTLWGLTLLAGTALNVG